jgi:alanine dehydrogenase
MALADKGWRKAITDDPALALGLNTHEGQVTNEGVASAFGMTAVAPLDAAKQK